MNIKSQQESFTLAAASKESDENVFHHYSIFLPPETVRLPPCRQRDLDAGNVYIWWHGAVVLTVLAG
jgi:hypothetical protein